MITLSDIAIRVKRNFGDESGVQITDEDILRWCNDAVRDFASSTNNLFEARGRTTTVVGQATYALPPEMLKLRSVRYDLSVLDQYTQTDADMFIARNESNDNLGTPQIFWMYADELFLYPTPAHEKTLSIYYTRYPPDSVSLTDNINIPDEYRTRIVDYCLQQAYELDENFQAAAAKQQQLAQGLDQLNANQQSPRADLYDRITYVPEDDYTEFGWY